MEQSFEYQTEGTCSIRMKFVLDDSHVIKDFQVLGGCNGNLKGIRALIIGMKAEDVIARLDGITCRTKMTSCPDQISKALTEYLEKQAE